MAKIKSVNDEVKNLNGKEVEETTKVDLSKDIEKVETPVSVTSSPIDINELFSIIKNLQDEISSLKEEKKQIVETKAENIQEQKVSDSKYVPSKTEQLLEILASKKSDKEITIVHNREMMPGLSTHISLTGTTIDFHTLGEERTLSWQQFEECVSKYKKWFDKQIILLGAEHEDLCSKYNIPCVKRKGGKTITREDLKNIGTYNIKELETFYNSLTNEDKSFVCSYWLGKCYEKDSDFYDRYKIEALNRLAGNEVFDNILTVMNNEFSRKSR